MESWNIAGKKVSLFPAEQETAPLVLLHTFDDEGEAVYRAARAMTAAAFSFAAIGNLRWEEEMSPWASPPVLPGDTPCTGGAGAYLEVLTGRILPAIRSRLSHPPSCLALAGYSLAGLFAVYALYRTDRFSRIASASGSFWFPGFLAFAREQDMVKQPERVYFSLGDKEAKTRNKVLRTVEENTRALEAHYGRAGIRTVLEMNPGSHFRNATERMAKGIAWMIGDETSPETYGGELD